MRHPCGTSIINPTTTAANILFIVINRKSYTPLLQPEFLDFTVECALGNV